MRRTIEWVEKVGPGVKRKVRVTFPGKGKVKWQFKRSDDERWDYDSPPDSDDWEFLEEKMERAYQRRRFPFETLELVRKLRQEADS